MTESFENPGIAAARAVALSILKPTDADLQRGLALHADSVVVDSYGFSAFAAPDVQAIQAAADDGATAAELEWLKVQSMMTRMATDRAEEKAFRAAWDASGVTCVIRNSGEEGNHIPTLIERLAHNTFVTDQLPDMMIRATRPAHIEAAKKAGKHCFYFTTNGVPLPQQFVDTQSELSHIGIFFQLGVRMMHLTYNRSNPIGTGCAEEQDGGLTDFGRSVVREMNRVGVMVDGAHSSLQTCFDMAQCSDKPVVISHAVCAAVNQHCRAKTDQVLKAVADTNGFFGVCCISAFLGGSGDIVALLDHIDHAVNVMGIDHVGIGTDVSTSSPNAAEAMNALPASTSVRARWEGMWPEDDAIFDHKWHDPRMSQSMAWTNWPMFTVGLVQRGYSDEDIRKIIGLNILRVAGDVLR